MKEMYKAIEELKQSYQEEYIPLLLLRRSLFPRILLPRLLNLPRLLKV